MKAISTVNLGLHPAYTKTADAYLEHRFFLLFCSIYFVVSASLLQYSGITIINEFFAGFFKFLKNGAFLGLVTIAIYAARLLVLERPKKSPTMFVYKDLRQGPLSDENIPRCLFSMIGLAAVMSAFLLMKPAIPSLLPFSYDPLFESLDRVMHLGYQPWQILQPLLGHEWITLILHRCYYFWFPVIYITFFWQVAARSDLRLRMQFLLSFVACWVIVGSLMATLMSSAGPIYYDRVVIDNPHVYSDAMNYLSSVHSANGLFMFEIKDALWNHYTGTSQSELVKGISAMPSMHVSLAFLLVLFGWRKGKIARAFYSIFAIFIALGSVHLLWHYAIDGYVAIIATWLVWILSGRIAQQTQSV